VELFSTEDATWTDLSKLDRVKPGSVTASEEILLHSEVNEEAVKQESDTWFRIFSVVDYD
jgi:hypothetical protein